MAPDGPASGSLPDDKAPDPAVPGAGSGAAPGTPREASALPHPEKIGSYRIVGVLGEGGMGTVYEAEQVEAIHRRVALKLIKLGMDTREVVARFEAERQALGVMDHPGIARVLDGGATDDGRPYFVMELVHGVPLTAWCDESELPMRERLALFVELCRAVQHAHQKGVIHRDLKPSNVLVVAQDGRPVPKVIDFGVAKAVGGRAGQRGYVTDQGQAIGTPAYMSPEQADAAGVDVDTRSDVYSLGVMLYELLVGALPVDWETVGAQTWLQRLARHETNPPTPSARLTSLGAQQADVARRRRTNPKSLRRELRGDLDWVVMKALEPDRARRYETADALAADVQRYLDGQPVLAHAPSAAYAVRKFARRHRTGIAAAGAVAVALVLGLAGTAIGLMRAQREAKTATEALDFLVGTFEEADPWTVPGELHEPVPGERPAGETITAKEILERGARRLKTQLQDEPLPRARLLDALGRVNTSLGLHDLAEPQLREALDIRRRELGPQHPDTAKSLESLGSLLHQRGDYVGSLAIAEEVLEARERELGPDDPRTADALADVGHGLLHRGDLAGARSRLESAAAALRRLQGADDIHLSLTLGILGNVRVQQGDYAGAKAAYEEQLAIVRRTLGPDHPMVAGALGGLGSVAHATGDFATARRLHEEVLERRRKTLGPEHPDIAIAMNNLANGLTSGGHDAEAKPLLEQSIAMFEKTLGPDSARVAPALDNLGKLLQREGDLDGAVSLQRRALDLRLKGLGPRSPETALGTSNLAAALQAKGETTAVRDLLEGALAAAEAAGSEPDAVVATYLETLGAFERSQGDLEAAQARYERAVAVRRATQGPDHPMLASALHSLSMLLSKRGDKAGWRATAEEALAIDRKAYGPDSHRLTLVLHNLASACVRTGDTETAAGYFAEAVRVARRGGPASRASAGPPLLGLGSALLQLGDIEGSEACLRDALDVFQTEPTWAGNEAFLPQVYLRLSMTLCSAGRAAESDMALLPLKERPDWMALANPGARPRPTPAVDAPRAPR